jgi:PAS domain S-box-containing protein
MGKQTDGGTGDAEPRDGTAEVTNVLYVDDPPQTDAVTDFVRREYDTLTVVSETSREAARQQVTRASFDCIVVELKFATAITDVCGETPLVLFTETDPTAISDEVLDQVDTVVQKGEEGHTDFLVDKILGVVRANDQREESTAERIVSSVPDARTESFLLDETGTVRWSSAPVEEYFPTAVAETPTEMGLHERLSCAATGEYCYTEELAAAVATDSAVERVGLEVPREGPPSVPESATYSCWSYPLDGEGRLETYRNVTAEIEQGQRLDKLEELVELARDGLYMLDADARYTFVTERYADLLGYEREELLGRHASSVMSEGALGRGQKAVESLLRDSSRESAVVDQIHQHKSGEELQFSIHFTVLTDDDGSYDGLMGVARDVTERRQREQELTEYKRVFETVFDRVYVLDGNGRIRLANDPFASLVGATVDGVEGAPAAAVFGPDAYQEIRAVVEEIRASANCHGRTELTLTDGSGNEIPCETDIALLPDDDGGCVGVIRDISERVQREQQVAVLDRVLRHNLGNDLTVVLGRAELLAESVDDPAEREMVETIQRRCDRLIDFAEKARRAQRVLDHALTKQPNSVGVEEVVDRVATRIGNAHPAARVSVDTPEDVTATIPRTINIALTDLAKNAVEHNDSDHPLVEIAVQEDGDTVEIAVADDGPGIPQNELDVLLNGTETPLKHGSGIGFWLVHWIVGQCGGELAVDERTPRGSIVTMTLPAAEPR